jgi:3-oxoadipate enol-lactonase
MTKIRIDDFDMHVRVDDHTDPWRDAEAVVFLHGNAESGEAWYAWVPHFSRRYRVIRPDMRGFGRSSPMPADYPWTIQRLVADNIALLDHLHIQRVHVVAAKIGTCIAMKLAAEHPERVASVTLLGAPASISSLAAGGPPVELVESHGVEAWARVNMGARLGSAMPPEAGEWWSRYMGRTAASTQIGFMRRIAIFDVQHVLEQIHAPTLVVTTEGSGIGSIAATKAWQERIPDSRLLVLPGDSYHVAVSDADLCAGKTLSFIGGLQER